jgi:hypothetical protein
MTQITTTTTTTTDAEIRMDILASRTSSLTFDTYIEMVDAKIIRINGNKEIWKITLANGRTMNIAATSREMDF